MEHPRRFEFNQRSIIWIAPHSSHIDHIVRCPAFGPAPQATRSFGICVQLDLLCLNSSVEGGKVVAKGDARELRDEVSDEESQESVDAFEDSREWTWNVG
jgi:hypothetical protein